MLMPLPKESLVYLDHNATTPPRPEAIAATTAALAECGNPSSVHAYGRAQRALIEQSRASLAEWLDVPADWVTFTAGGTEANNQAISGISGARVLASAVEHDSVLSAAPDASRIPVDAEGRIRLDALTDLLAREAGDATLVSVMLANNETGVIQPVDEVAKLAHAHGTLVHCDAVQGAGKLNLATLCRSVDMVTLSAHKMGGPQGVGALIASPAIPLHPILRGGGQERGRRAGTEATALIAGFGAAVRALAADGDAGRRMLALREQLEREALAANNQAVVYGAGAQRIANTTCLGRPGLTSDVQVIALDLAGVAVSAGAACSSGKVRKSHVLAAMGVPDEPASRAIRVSVGWTSTAGDVERFISAWRALGRGGGENAA
jgi:cysteine desulfurase